MKNLDLFIKYPFKNMDDYEIMIFMLRKDIKL